MTVDDVELRELVPQVLSVLVRRGADFATAEDAVQEALIRALSAWGDELPADPTGWLITVAWRAFLDMTRSDAARRDREVRFDTEPPAGAVPSADDTLRLYFLCAHPDLTSSSAVALTLRAVGGLTTRQIAQAYLVPEPTMAQRISRAKRTVSRAGVDRPGDVRTVMRVLYLVFNEGYSGDVDLAAEAIRLTRQLAALVDDPEVHGLLALMLLHHARRRSRTRPDGSIVPLAEQDRSQWDTELIAEGIDIAQAALARDQLGEYQAQAAIAALHADAPRVEETDWVQIVEWYDELLRFADTPIVRLNRAVAVGEADGAPAGLAALAEVDEHVPRREAVAAYLHEKNGDLELAARLYADAAATHPTSPNATTRRARPRDSTSSCNRARDRGVQLEVDRGLGPGLDGVEVVGPHAGREVLPPAVAHDHHDRALLDEPRRLHRAGQDRSRRDAGEDADLGEAAGPLDRLAGAHDEASVEEVEAVVVEEHRRDEALVDVLEPVDHLPRRRLDGPDLHVGVALLEEAPDAHERAGRAQPGDEVGELGDVAPDLRAGALVVRLRVGGVAVLEREPPLGVLRRHAPGPCAWRRWSPPPRGC